MTVGQLRVPVMYLHVVSVCVCLHSDRRFTAVDVPTTTTHSTETNSRPSSSSCPTAASDVMSPSSSSSTLDPVSHLSYRLYQLFFGTVSKLVSFPDHLFSNCFQGTEVAYCVLICHQETTHSLTLTVFDF